MEAARSLIPGELEFMTWLKEQGFRNPKPLIGMPGYWAAIMPLLFHYSIQGGWIGDKVRLSIRYCYTADPLEVVTAFAAWDGTGEPLGWHSDKMTGRRRPGGDASKEYIEW